MQHRKIAPTRDTKNLPWGNPLGRITPANDLSYYANDLAFEQTQIASKGAANH